MGRLGNNYSGSYLPQNSNRSDADEIPSGVPNTGAANIQSTAPKNSQPGTSTSLLNSVYGSTKLRQEFANARRDLDDIDQRHENMPSDDRFGEEKELRDLAGRAKDIDETHAAKVINEANPQQAATTAEYLGNMIMQGNYEHVLTKLMGMDGSLRTAVWTLLTQNEDVQAKLREKEQQFMENRTPLGV